MRWISELFAPARRRHPDQRLEGDRKGGLQPARERAAIGGKHAAADPGVVRQPRKSRHAAGCGEPLVKKLRIAAFCALAEHKNRSDCAIGAERRRWSKHRFACDRAAVVEQNTAGGIAHDDRVAIALERTIKTFWTKTFWTKPFRIVMRKSVGQDHAAVCSQRDLGGAGDFG